MADQSPPQEENRNGGRQRRQREDQVPIEELFDLSQPIPRVRVLAHIMCLILARV